MAFDLSPEFRELQQVTRVFGVRTMSRSIREAAERTLSEATDCCTLALAIEMLEELDGAR